MSLLRTIDCTSYVNFLHVTHEFLYAIVASKLTSFDVATFEPVTETADEDYVSFACASGLLFCGSSLSGHLSSDHLEVVVLDSRTLAEQRRFGGVVLHESTGVLHLEVVGEELYAVCSCHGRIHVFSFAGEHLRDINGGWREAARICHYNDRLYLCEYIGEDEEAVENEREW